MKKQKRLILLLVILVVVSGAAAYYRLSMPELVSPPFSFQKKPAPPKGGKILAVESVQSFTPEQVLAISKQNYAASAPQPTGGVTKAVIEYTSYDGSKEITEYARIYVPSAGSNLPMLGFAPGTTGIGDQCAASLEQPAVSNWANYESHMVTYAGQGYATVITDYEGMRDPSRLHHYMVGELEGRAVLDSLRALGNWSGTADRIDKNKLFIAGFSQGGHSAMWADKIAASYAPDIKIKGVVGFGPVSDVKQTLIDATKGANILWFGPFVLASYQDYYHADYDAARVLEPKWLPKLATDTTANCIDRVQHVWTRPVQNVYTPEFIQASARGGLSQSGYGKLERDLDKNAVGDQKTTSAKLINQGGHDNVVLPGQQQQFVPKLCKSSRGPVALKIYPGATHYNVMVQSLQDTLTWLRQVGEGEVVLSTCSG